MKKKTRYVIVRGTNSGCFMGEFVSLKGTYVVLKNSRRLWYWTGAASLSELAQRGTSSPETCKFPVPITSHEVLDCIEILDVTKDAKASIDSVKPWSQ